MRPHHPRVRGRRELDRQCCQGKCSNAIICADPLRIVTWATDARRPRGRPRKDAPARPDSANATGIKRCRYALLRNPDTLSSKQVVQLDWVVRTHSDLDRAYYIKEGLRMIFKLPLDEAIKALDKWISWAMVSLGGHRPALPGRK